MKKIIHVDMDAFFASIEIVRNPELKGKPIVITNSPGERGVVSTASYEARKYGIYSSMPLKKAKSLCKDLVVIRGNFSLYSQISEEIMEFLSNFTYRMEIRSIDEAYLDVTETERIFGGAKEIGRKIKEGIRRKFNLTCSVGISYNKLLSKIATELSKPDGLLEIGKEDLYRYYYPLPVEKIPGIGPKSAKNLKKIGIVKVLDLKKYGYEELLRNFKPSFVEFLIKISKGEGDEEVSYRKSPPKSISSRMTFERDTKDVKFMESVLSILSEEVGGRLREENLLAKGVKITIRYKNFKTTTHQRKLSLPVNGDSDILKEALTLLREKLEDKPVRLLGVTVMYLIKSNSYPFLFSVPKSEDRFLKTIDKLKKKFGEDKVHLLKSIIKKQR